MTETPTGLLQLQFGAGPLLLGDCFCLHNSAVFLYRNHFYFLMEGGSVQKQHVVLETRTATCNHNPLYDLPSICPVSSQQQQLWVLLFLFTFGFSTLCQQWWDGGCFALFVH